MNRLTVLGLVLVGLGLGAWWVHADRAHTREVATLLNSRDSANLALRATAERERAREAVNAALGREVAALRQRANATTNVADAVRDTLWLRDSSFALKLSDSLKADFRRVIAGHDSLDALRLAVISDLRQSGADQDQRLTLRDTSMAECRAGLTVALKQRDTALRIANPSLLTKAVRGMPVLAAGVLLGVLLH